MASDPASIAPQEGDPRPVVRTALGGRLGVLGFMAALLLGGYLLFSAMESRRADIAAPAIYAEGAPRAVISAPPPLVLPAEPLAPPPAPVPQLAVAAPITPPRPAVTPNSAPTFVEPPRGKATPAFNPIPADPPQPSVVFDQAFDRPTAPSLAAASTDGEDRVRATRLSNPSSTVPRGTVIAAVLETALNSTHEGAARALVSRDVYSFDGSRVLVPRGSRLYGEYGAEINAGQNRALIRWTRLLRPDGVIMNLDSPSADPLGRAGVKGNVNSHFFTRFGSAILQSALDIGVALATRSVSDDRVIVALPDSTQTVISPEQQQVRPTLTVKQGTSVSVFVARDLDFSSVQS